MITAAILNVGYQAAKSVGQRLLDAAVDPGIVASISEPVASVAAVVGVTEVRARWADELGRSTARGRALGREDRRGHGPMQVCAAKR